MGLLGRGGRVLLLVLLVLLGLACAPRGEPTPTPAPAAAPEEREVIRLKAVGTSRALPQFEILEWLAEEVNRRTDGRVEVEVVGLPELGLTGFELVRVLQAGLVDIGDVLPGYVSGDVPVIEGVDIAGLFRDWDAYEEAYSAWIQVLQEKQEQMGGVFLGAHAWATQVLFSRKPIETLEDLKGMKIRVWSTSQAEYLQALGAEPVSLPFAEVYTALERGTIDGVITGTDAGFRIKLYEVSRYLVDIGIGPKMTAVVMSRKTWDRLPEELRRTFLALAEEMTRRGFELGKELTETGIQGNTEQGMVWVPMKEEWKEGLDRAREEAVRAWARRAGEEGVEAFNRVLAPLVGFTLSQ